MEGRENDQISCNLTKRDTSDNSVDIKFDYVLRIKMEVQNN
jgi:hypothetical protein